LFVCLFVFCRRATSYAPIVACCFWDTLIFSVAMEQVNLVAAVRACERTIAWLYCDTARGCMRATRLLLLLLAASC
jgi:hypothetical protein